jgi:CDP-diacylglycerol--serine O-phosphatidyltransferase
MKTNKRLGEIYLLPNLLTLTNVSFGFLSVLAAFDGNYSRAAFWIIMAAIIDGLDGIIARATGTQSDFGIQLDSLADCFSFGAVPTILLYFWGFRHVDASGSSFFFSFIFFIAAILRLAQYNSLQKQKPDRRFYKGLTTPSASLLIAAIVLNHPEPLSVKLHTFVLAFIVIVLSSCMLSNIKYRNFLNFNFRYRIDILTAFLLAILLISILIYPNIFLIVYFSLNVLSGPSTYLYEQLKNRRQKAFSLKKEESL